MPNNEREIARLERQHKKERKKKIIIWIILALIILLLAVMKVLEIDYNSIKNRFTDENGKFTILQTA